MADEHEVPAVVHHLAVPRMARYLTLGAADASEIWFVLHGYLQDVSRFLSWFADAAGPDRLIVAPEGLSRAYTDAAHQRVGASWMTREEREAEITDYVRYLDLVAREVLPRGQGKQIQIHGFSQGAATAARWAVQGQVRPDALVLWGGTVPPDLTASQLEIGLRGQPVQIVVGTQDEYYTPKVISRERARLDSLGIAYRYSEFEGTHRVELDALR